MLDQSVTTRGDNGRGDVMPPPRDTGLTADLIREYLEESRRGTTEVLNLTNKLESFHAEQGKVESRLDEVLRVLRGDGDELGLVGRTKVVEEKAGSIDDRLREVETDLKALSREGPRASQQTLSLVELRQQEGFRRIEALEKQHQDSVSRTWWIIGQVVTAGIGTGALLVALFHR